MNQNYNNHKRFYPLFHFITIPLTVLGLGLAIYTMISITNIVTGLIALAFILMLFIALMSRIFALKAQDRAARAEEKLRYFILTSKALPNELKLGQILALRFASDAELEALVDKTIVNNLSPNDIKKEITNWRGDYHRV